MKKVILIRHGESVMNVQKLYYGWLDPQLTEVGRGQARSAREILEKLDYDKIYSSDLKRAYETAELLNYKDLTIEKSSKIRELNFGIFEGYTYEELCKKYPKEIEEAKNDWKSYSYVTGESLGDLQRRSVEFIEALEDDKTHVIVAHWGVICTTLSYYLSENLDSYWKYKVDNGSLTTLEFVDGDPILTALNIKE